MAVKKLRKEGVPPDDLENYFNKEKKTLKFMRKLHHEHLVEAIAVYEKGTVEKDKYFVFPWATGGNLRSFWRERNHSTDEPRLMDWILHQVTGLADGLAKLHKGGFRHGDIKPENILLFLGDNGTKRPALGTLVLADVGIAKFHADHTSTRRRADYVTTNKYGTFRYEPPEIEMQINDTETQEKRNVSRKVDAWSMGCVLLEFVIWLLRGSQGQKDFDNELLKTEPKQDRFWIRENDIPQIHPVAGRWIKKLLQSTDQTPALKALLNLVKGQLLVWPENSRAGSAEMHSMLLDINKKSLDDPSYMWDSTSTILIDRREMTADIANEDFVHRSQQVGL